MVSSQVESTEYSTPAQEVDTSPSHALDKAEAKAQTHSLADADADLEGNDKTSKGRPWEVGFRPRFPVLSFGCLLAILASMAGLITVLEISNGKNVETWDSKTVIIAKHQRRWKVGVSTWIAVFNFIMGQAIAVMFAEAVAISWWVDALKGQTLDLLHFRWEVGSSFFKIILRRRFWGWICVASVALTAFAGLETLLQTASFPKLVLSQRQADMTAMMANALPAGFSAIYAQVGHGIYAPVSYTSPFIEILQNYSVQSPVHFDLNGCPSVANGWCTVTLPGIGFQYTCTGSRGAVVWETEDPSPNGTSLFNVNFEKETWQITLNAAWKDVPGASSAALAQRACTLVPAIVEYPVNVTSQRTVTLEPPTSSVVWTSNSTDTGNTSLPVDKVLRVLPIPYFDSAVNGPQGFTGASSFSTLGGIGLAFSRLFDSSITAGWDSTSGSSSVRLDGSFGSVYARFNYGTASNYMMQNTIRSPMDELLKDIRDIMFRSTISIVQNNITSYHLTGIVGQASQDAQPPAENVTKSASYFVYETVYQTSHVTLGLAIGLMLLAILAIMPLYWGFWNLGRKVTISPIEIAKALHYSTRPNPKTEALEDYSVLEPRDRDDRPSHVGSNFPDDELVKLLGNTKVRYGEVAPNVLGIGLEDYTNAARKELSYK